MSERKPGWYWVGHDGIFWEPREWCASSKGWVISKRNVESPDFFEFVAGRIPEPDEPWQCVPIVPTREMMESTGDTSAEAYSGMLGAWMMMLSSAPQPEDV